MNKEYEKIFTERGFTNIEQMATMFDYYKDENDRYKNIIDKIKKLCDENTNGIDDDGYDDAYYDRVYVREIDEIIEKGLKGE